MVKIQRRLCRKKYLNGKYTYAYERYYIEIPRKHQKKLKPLLNRELKMEIRNVDGKLIIVLSPCRNVSAGRKQPL